MDPSRKGTLSPSSARSRRSQTNLADLRLSPLSTKYTAPAAGSSHEVTTSSSTSEEPYDTTSFKRSHSSYLHGKSAPTTPGILSRSSSRKRVGAGLSRRGSFYDNDADIDDFSSARGLGGFEYAGVVRDDDGSARVVMGSGQISKAKSEAALLVQRSKQGSKSGNANARRAARLYQARSRTGGTNTPLFAPNTNTATRSKSRGVDDDWLTRTGAATNAMLQENQGSAWTASSSASLSMMHSHLQDSTTDEEDEGYEELAAQSAGSSRRHLVGLQDGDVSPVSTRASQWGSRFGSRSASRRTSRRGSISLTTTGSRTPLAMPGGGDGAGEYFDDQALSMPLQPDFVDGDDGIESQDEAALNRLAQTRSFGVGGIIDRIMNFGLFNVEEREEATEDEAAERVSGASETAEQARLRREAENKRKREEKEKLVKQRTDGVPRAGDGKEGDEGKESGGWASDAAWLFGVASRAIF